MVRLAKQRLPSFVSVGESRIIFNAVNGINIFVLMPTFSQILPHEFYTRVLLHILLLNDKLLLGFARFVGPIH